MWSCHFCRVGVRQTVAVAGSDSNPSDLLFVRPRGPPAARGLILYAARFWLPPFISVVGLQLYLSFCGSLWVPYTKSREFWGSSSFKSIVESNVLAFMFKCGLGSKSMHNGIPKNFPVTVCRILWFGSDVHKYVHAGLYNARTLTRTRCWLSFCRTTFYRRSATASILWTADCTWLR